MNHDLKVALCRSITARALAYGAEAAELEHGTDDMKAAVAARFRARAAAARRRYWREQAACELLHGRRWPEAEALGVEPNG
jgi:hypothetical protein